VSFYCLATLPVSADAAQVEGRGGSSLDNEDELIWVGYTCRYTWR